jgi:hypothetical protein
LSSNVALENVANVFSAKQSFSGVDHAGLCLNSLTTAEYNALTAANGDLFRDSTADRIDARLASGTVELLDTRGNQVVLGALQVNGVINANSATLQFANRTLLAATNSSILRVTDAAAAAGFSIDCATDNQMTLRNRANSAAGNLNVGNLTASGTINNLQIDTFASRGRIIQAAGVGIDIQANELTNPLFRVSYAGSEFPLSVTRSTVTVTGNLTASGTVRLGTYTVGTLPSASANTRALAYVTDSNVGTFGSVVSAGGSLGVTVYSNGTNWLVTGGSVVPQKAITSGTAAPSGGVDGDIYLQYV